MRPTRKMQAVGGVGAVVVAAIAAAQSYGVHITPELAALLTLVVPWVAGWLRRDTPSR